MNFSHDLNENNLSMNSAGEPASPTEATAHSADVEPTGGEAVIAEIAALVGEAAAPAVAAVDSTPPEVAAKTESAPVAKQPETAPQDVKTAPQAKSNVETPRGSLIPFIPPQRSEQPPQQRSSEFWRIAFEKRFQFGAIAAGLALVGVFTVASIAYKEQQNQYFALQNVETQNLAETVKALKARIVALEAAKHDEITDIRKTAVDLKNGLAATHDANTGLAQLSARFDRLEHEQEARVEKLGERVDHEAATHNADFAAKLEKLGERVDHDAATHNADFATRLEKLERKATTPVVASAAPAPQPAPATVLPKALTASPPIPPVISKETTGSIAPARETTGSIAPARGPIHGWVVREVHDGLAVVEGRGGEFREIGPGDMLPGAGRVERIEKHESGWVVVTNQGYFQGAAFGDF